MTDKPIDLLAHKVATRLNHLLQDEHGGLMRKSLKQRDEIRRLTKQVSDLKFDCGASKTLAHNRAILIREKSKEISRLYDNKIVLVEKLKGRGPTQAKHEEIVNSLCAAHEEECDGYDERLSNMAKRLDAAHTKIKALDDLVNVEHAARMKAERSPQNRERRNLIAERDNLQKRIENQVDIIRRMKSQREADIERHNERAASLMICENRMREERDEARTEALVLDEENERVRRTLRTIRDLTQNHFPDCECSMCHAFAKQADDEQENRS